MHVVFRLFQLSTRLGISRPDLFFFMLKSGFSQRTWYFVACESIRFFRLKFLVSAQVSSFTETRNLSRKNRMLSLCEFSGDWREKNDASSLQSPSRWPGNNLCFNENLRVFTGIYSLFVGPSILFGLQFHLQLARNLIFSK